MSARQTDPAGNLMVNISPQEGFRRIYMRTLVILAYFINHMRELMDGCENRRDSGGYFRNSDVHIQSFIRTQLIIFRVQIQA